MSVRLDRSSVVGLQRPDPMMKPPIAPQPAPGRAGEAPATRTQTPAGEAEAAGPTQSVPVPEEERRYSTEFLDKVGRELSEFFEVVNTRISLSVNQDLGRVIIKIIDNDTDEVLRQIPPEQMIAMAERIQDLLGLLLDEKA